MGQVSTFLSMRSIGKLHEGGRASGAAMGASGSSFAEALRRKDFAIIFDWFAICFFWGAVASIVVIFVAACFDRGFDGLRIGALAIAFSAASTVCGWLLGLLFGIPRTLARPQPLTTIGAEANNDKTSAASGSPSSRVNTNLEDVSDWLTKTLVGVGLTQLYFVPHYLWQSAEKINSAGFAWTHGQALILSLFLYFAPGGFWLGYIGTRTMLTKLFDSIEGPTPTQVEVALSPAALKLDLAGKNVAPAQTVELKQADAALLKMPVTAMNSPQQLGAWGAARARAGDYASAIFALKNAVDSDHTDPLLSSALGTVYVAQRRTTEASEVLQNAQDTEAALLTALYEDSPAGIARAIEIGTRLSARAGADKNLNLHVWLACAYGQQHKQALQNQDAALAAKARENVVKEVKLALQIDSVRAKPWLLSLWRPQQGAVDDDLASIPHDDAELSALLLDGTAP